MTDAIELESTKRQLTKDILRDLNVEKVLIAKYENSNKMVSQLIEEYGKYYRELYQYIHDPFEQKKD